MPTPANPVTPAELYGPGPGPGFDMSRLRFTAPFNFNGAPTLTLPCGLSDDGLPLSLQIVGKPLGEAPICRVGQAYERATTWHTLRPPV
jgi:amidase